MRHSQHSANNKLHAARRSGASPILTHITHIIFSTLSGEALVDINSRRGSNAEMPCMFCLNVRNRNSVEMLHHGGEYYVSHTEFDVTKLRYHTDESVRDIARDLQVRSNIESKTRFTLTQKQFGFTHNPGSILLDDRLVAIYKPISATVFDWMHVLLIDGVFAIHMGCLMARLKEFAVTCATLHTFVKNWHWPGRINSRGVSGKDLCDPKHDAKWYELEKFKPSASEVLSLYPVFALFFATLALPGELCRPEITCFLLLCDVVDAFMLVARAKMTAERLHDVIVRYLTSFKAVHGDEYMVPKFHWLLHCGWQYMKHGILIACFVHERKHRMLKRYARAIRNTSRDWEQSMLAEVTDHHLAALDHEDFSFDARLVGESLKRPAADLVALLRVAFGGNADIKIANDARFSEWGVARRGDVVMIVANGVHVVGRAFLFAAIDGDIFVGVDLWTRIDATRGSSRWRVSGDRRAVLDASAILETLIWSQTLDVATVIVPPWL